MSVDTLVVNLVAAVLTTFLAGCAGFALCVVVEKVRTFHRGRK